MSDANDPRPGLQPEAPTEVQPATHPAIDSSFTLPDAPAAPLDRVTGDALPAMPAYTTDAASYEPVPWPSPPSSELPLPGGGQSMLDHAIADAPTAVSGKRTAPSVTPPRSSKRKAKPSSDAANPNTDDDPEQPGQPRSRRPVVLAAAATLVAIALALAVVLGHFNAQRLAIHCEPDRIVATSGRSFPPWGESTLDAPEFAAIAIPKDTECTARTTTNRTELEDWYLTALMEQATARLTTRAVADVELASKQLEQALLLTRVATRRDARKEVDRLVGDVEYWRAAARLKASSDALLEAATQFDAAAKKRPRHATDAAEWAVHVRRLVELLRAGPNGVTSLSPSTSGFGLAPIETPTSPPVPATGSAVPIAPDAPTNGSSPPATGGVLL